MDFIFLLNINIVSQGKSWNQSFLTSLCIVIGCLMHLGCEDLLVGFLSVWCFLVLFLFGVCHFKKKLKKNPTHKTKPPQLYLCN